MTRVGRGCTEKLCKNPAHFKYVPLDEFPIKNGRKTAWCKQCLQNQDIYQRVLAFVADNPMTYGLEVSKELGISRYTAKKVITQLYEDNILLLEWGPKDGRINYRELSESGEQDLA